MLFGDSNSSVSTALRQQCRDDPQASSSATGGGAHVLVEACLYLLQPLKLKPVASCGSLGRTGSSLMIAGVRYLMSDAAFHPWRTIAILSLPAPQQRTNLGPNVCAAVAIHPMRAARHCSTRSRDISLRLGARQGQDRKGSGRLSRLGTRVAVARDRAC
jgi:hypothetical protein